MLKTSIGRQLSRILERQKAGLPARALSWAESRVTKKFARHLADNLEASLTVLALKGINPFAGPKGTHAVPMYTRVLFHKKIWVMTEADLKGARFTRSEIENLRSVVGNDDQLHFFEQLEPLVERAVQAKGLKTHQWVDDNSYGRMWRTLIVSDPTLSPRTIDNFGS